MTSCTETQKIDKRCSHEAVSPVESPFWECTRHGGGNSSPPWLQVAMVSVHTCPLARLGSRETGGMNVYVRELSRQLGRLGVQVDVFTRRQDNTTPDVVQFGDNARVIHLEAGPTRPMDKYRVLEHLDQFDAGVRDFARNAGRRYDLVHSHYWLSGRVAETLAAEWGTPLVTMFHTLGHLKNRVSSNGNERERRARIDIERETMFASSRLVAASPTDMEQMVRYYDAPAERIRVIPAGVDTGLFHPYPGRAARESVGMGSEPQLLFVGRIQALKGIDLLISAFASLLRNWGSDPKPRLTIVGGQNIADVSDPESQEMARLKILAGELGVASQVDFREAVPHQQLPLYYSAADVVVVPSLYESFGLVALESMACGTPVVASRVGGLQWTVLNGKTGFLVAKRSPERFAAAVRIILADRQLRERMSQTAVEVAAGYSWESVARQVLELYADLIPLPARVQARFRG